LNTLLNIFFLHLNTYNYIMNVPTAKEAVPMKEFVPYKHEKEVISIRIDSEMLKTVDSSAEHAGISRNEFINQCIAFALNHLSSKDK